MSHLNQQLLHKIWIGGGELMNAREWNNKGATLAAQGQYGEALACYDRALQFSLDDRSMPTENIWRNKGHLYDEVGRPSEALTCCDNALEINPTMPRHGL